MITTLFIIFSFAIVPFIGVPQHQEPISAEPITLSASASLEFKEVGTVSDDDIEEVRQNAQTALDKINNGEDFTEIANQEVAANGEEVELVEVSFTFESDLPTAIKSAVTSLSPGEHTQNLVEISGTYSINSIGEVIEDTGFAIINLQDSKEEVINEKEVYVSHILISYDSAQAAEDSVTRSEDEAWALINEIKNDINNGSDFSTLAKKYSDDTTNKSQGGKLEQPVSGDGLYVYDFEQTALKLKQAGQISNIIKTQFGYHLIKADKIAENVKETQYKYDSLTYSTTPDLWANTELNETYLLSAEVALDQYSAPYITLIFNDEGSEIFADLTEKNIGKPLGIFVNGELLSAPTVNSIITGGEAVITGNFTMEEANTLAASLNAAIADAE